MALSPLRKTFRKAGHLRVNAKKQEALEQVISGLKISYHYTLPL